MRRGILGLIVFLVATIAIADTALAGVTIAGQFHFREHIGPNPIGSVTGDRQVVGAVSVVPSGTPTVASATQGGVTRGVTPALTFLPWIPLYPNQYATSIDFDPARTASWTLTASREGDVAVPVLTNAIPVPRLLPLVENLDVLGTGTTPTLLWRLPELPGIPDPLDPVIDRIRVRVHDAATRVGLMDFFAPANATAFRIPAGRLEYGRDYGSPMPR